MGTLGYKHTKDTKEKISKSMLRNTNSVGKLIGSKNPNWKGGINWYGNVHNKLNRKFGKPKQCDICKTTDPSKVYEWANLTGNYLSEKDYKRMCRSCHSKYDKKGRKVK